MLMWLIHLSLIGYISSFRNSIELKKISVPVHPQVNQTISLMCDYKLNGEKLYSVKWYKDNIEFYRYLPRDDPPSLSFSVSGIQVVLSLSDHSTVYLTNITLETSGLFQCEVSTEAPKFKTVAADAVMNVVQPPTSTPRLEWINMREKLRRKVGNYYGATVGDRLRIMCSSEGSFPAASLRFYINDEIANDQNVRTINNHHKMKGLLKSSQKELDIILERRHFRYGDLTIKCTSDIYDIYFQSSKLTFVGLDLGEMALGRHTVNSGTRSFKSMVLAVFYLVAVKCISWI